MISRCLGNLDAAFTGAVERFATDGLEPLSGCVVVAHTFSFARLLRHRFARDSFADSWWWAQHLLTEPLHKEVEWHF